MRPPPGEGAYTICRKKFDEQDVQIHLTSAEAQSAYLSALDGLDAVKAVVPIGADGVLSEDEKQLYDLLAQVALHNLLLALEPNGQLLLLDFDFEIATAGPFWDRNRDVDFPKLLPPFVWEGFEWSR